MQTPSSEAKHSTTPRNPFRSLARLESDDRLRGTIHLNTWMLRGLDDLSDDDRQRLRWQRDAAKDELTRRWERGLQHDACTFGFDTQVIERIKTAWPIEHVIERDTELKRSGDGYRGRCPIHGGDNPYALSVKPGTDGAWYCFVCGIGGDVLTWIMATQQVEFTDALRLLAVLVGEPLPLRERPERKPSRPDGALRYPSRRAS